MAHHFIPPTLPPEPPAPVTFTINGPNLAHSGYTAALTDVAMFLASMEPVLDRDEDGLGQLELMAYRRAKRQAAAHVEVLLRKAVSRAKVNDAPTVAKEPAPCSPEPMTGS